MRILITGSGGFIGGSLGRFAGRAGHEILGLARGSQPDRDWPGRHLAVDVSHADISGVVREFAPDVIFHGAGTASVADSMRAPFEDFRAAMMTWANVLDAVRRSGLRPFVMFPSSAAVYGNPRQLPVKEDALIAPISPYGFHKAACELIAREYAECFKIPVMVCRLFSVFGPAQRRLLVWELFEQLNGSTADVQLQGTGQETRDYLHVDNLCEAIIYLALHAIALSEPELTVVNVASGKQTTSKELLERIRHMVAPEKAMSCKGISRPGDPNRWQADISELRKHVESWRPWELGEALSRCVEAWQVD